MPPEHWCARRPALEFAQILARGTADDDIGIWNRALATDIGIWHQALAPVYVTLCTLARQIDNVLEGAHLLLARGRAFRVDHAINLLPD